MSKCRCHVSNRCMRCPDAVDDWWIHFGLFWWVLGGAVNGVPIWIGDVQEDEGCAA